MKKIILVVDDMELNRALLAEIFGDNYYVLQAENGLQAINILKKRRSEISVMVLDLAMPVMDGFETLAEIKNNPALFKVPVIVATDYSDSKSEIRALELGAVDFIAKPYNSAIIQQRVKNIISLYENRAYRLLTERDKLTGIYNRQAFYSRTEERLSDNPDKDFDIICMDIERFKIVNDVFGTTEGDSLLKFIASLLLECCLDGNAVCGRLASDNFAMCIEHTENGVKSLVDFVLTNVKDYPLNIKIIVKFGIYRITNKNVPINVMCDGANMAIKGIKGSYSADAAYYSDRMRKKMLEEQEIVNEMNNALQTGQFIVYYQAKVNMAAERIIGSEALVRWIHPQKGMISPGVFIPVFERNGFIAALDYYIWDLVCRDLRKWLDNGYSPCPVSVNVSRAELYNTNLCEKLNNLITKYDIPIRLLQLEITESAYTENPEQLISVVHNLRENGFTILMDDFGSGYSSLNTLKDVPVDVLKIDLKFLYNINDNLKGNHILKSVVQMARRLNLTVIAEGVETRQQADFLKSIGCRRAQGFLYAKPMPKEQFVSIMNGTFLENSGDDDEVESLVNIDDIMSHIHVEGEIEWYRAAVLQLNALIAEYDIQNDSMILFDSPKDFGSKELVKIEIPNFMSVLKTGKFIYPDDIEEYLTLHSGIGTHKIRARVKDIYGESFYHWAEIIGRTMHNSDGNPASIILVFRGIYEEKFNELLMRVFTIFEENGSIASSADILLPQIAQTFTVDRITIAASDYKNNILKRSFTWARNSSCASDKAVKLIPQNEEFYLFKQFEKHGYAIINSDDINCPPNLANQIFPHDTMTVVISPLTIDGQNAGAIVYSSCGAKRSWTDKELITISEVAKCLSAYFEREYANERMRESLALYQIAFSKSSMRLWEFDIVSKRLYRSKAVRDEQGLDEYVDNMPDSFIESGVIHPDSVNDYRRLYQQISSGHDASCIFKSKHIDGSYKWMRISYTVIFDENGKPVKAVGVGEDVNEIYMSQSRLQNEFQYRKAVLADALFCIDADLTTGKILSNSTPLNGTNYPEPKTLEEFVEITANLFVHPDYKADFYAMHNKEFLKKNYEQGNFHIIKEFVGLDENKKYHWLEITFLLSYSESDGHIRVFTYVKDIDKRKRYELALERKAQIDGLTSIYNRETFVSMANKLLEDKTNFYSFMMIDIDNFKLVNDTFGHAYGDEVLTSVAGTIKSTLHTEDFVGRLGGDEFAVFMSACKNESEIEEVAKQLLSRLFINFSVDHRSNHISCSIGISTSKESGFTFEALYRNADEALYKAKNTGKGRYIFYEKNLMLDKT